MEEINPIKTYNFFYTPKITSHNLEKKRESLLENKSKQKIISQKEQIFPLYINIKNGNNMFLNCINDDKNESLNTNPNPNSNTNKNYYSQNYKNRKILFLPNMFYKNNNSNYYRNKSFYNQNKIKKGKTPNKINIKANNYISVINYNNYNDIYKNKENKESVEWMLFNKRKNLIQDSNNNMDILDEIYNLKKYDAYMQMQMNQFLVPPLFDYNNIYNSYNEFKKKHDKDYLLFGNNNLKRKSKESKDKKEKNNESDKNENDNNNRMIKRRKLCKYNILSVPGSHKGMEKINQDASLLLLNINDCKNIKLFGVFDGHGNYGELLSKQISEYFNTFFNNKNLYEEIKDKTDNNNNTNNDINNHNDNSCNINKRNKIKIKIEKYNFKTEVKQNDENETDKNNSKQKKHKLSIKTKFTKFTELNHTKRNSLFLSKFKSIKSMINNKISKNKKIKSAYDSLSSNNYSKIYNSFNTLDKILHDKYTINKICHGSGVALSFLILFNDHYLDNSPNDKIKSYKNYNKIISVNLGNTKAILISDDKKIKELNICHTPCVKEERLRVENNGGTIGKIDWLKVGPLRVWFKDKKYPGLSITRSLGDFEAEQLGILSIPDIKEFDVDEEKIKIIVMGTNGIWEFLTNDKIMDIVFGYYECEDTNGASQKIVETAGKLWKIKNPNNIPDLTVVVLFFK